MTLDEYWDGAPELVRYYRKSEQIRLERENHLLWLQGLYVYDALCSASPLFRSLAKRNTKAMPYVESPYPLTNHEYIEEQEQKEKKTLDRGKRYMESFLIAHNGKMKRAKENQAEKGETV